MSSVKLNGKLRYENLENEFNDAEEFLIDGDSLLLSAVNDESLNMIYGGQSLQLVYVIERKLKLFVQKGAKFSIIFLKFSNQFLWEKCVAVQLFREVLIYHLSSNLGYNVLRDFEDLLDNNFIQYLGDTKPSMVILSYEGIQLFRSTLFGLNEEEMQRIEEFLKVQINHYLELEMHVSLIESVHLTKTGLFGNIIVVFQQSQLKTKDKSKSNTPKLKKETKKKEKETNKCTRTMSFTGYPDTYTQSIAIQLKAGIEIFRCLQRQYPKISKDLVKIYFVYIAIKEKIPLRHRSYGASSNVSLPENILTIFQKSLLQIWCETDRKSDFNLVDIWSGNLYVKVLETFLEYCDSGKDIDESSRTMIFYQNILDAFVTAAGVEIEPFPVVDLKVFTFYKRSNRNDKIFKASSESMQVLKINSELQTIYAGELYNKLDVVGFVEDRDFDIKPEFLDEYHWHLKKSLIDYDVLKTIMIQRMKESENDAYKKTVQRGKARLALAKHRYSEFISGSNNKILIPSVKSKEGKKKSCKKKTDVSKKAEQIIEKNKKRQRQEKDSKTKREVNDLINAAKRLENENHLRNALEYLEMKDSKDTAFDISIVQCKIKLLIRLSQASNGKSEQIEYMRKLILLLRSLSDHKKLSQNRNDIVAALNHFRLFKLNFLLFEEKNLSQRAATEICHIEFQLKHMSHLLKKKLREDPDPRVKHFVPDQWQRDMFDYIDVNQSVLIVAPTSSGKTFASYYCMEKILRSSDEDVIVYVSPTKALCNQVMAMVNSLFEKSLSNGKKLCGVFTRDFHDDVKNCQILVTVPQCFELLLLSADSFDWSNKIKYVIFDEIHYIGSEDGAEVWEHILLMIKSPFLALSATVENPDLLQAWLQKTQDFLKERDEMLGVKRTMESYQVNLIKVEGRHSDLEKYHFSQEPHSPLKKIHPISSLNPKVVIKHGIPEHISLSAIECFSLYDKTENLFPEEKIFAQLSPDQYFEGEIFLTRDVIRNYSTMLKDKLSKWVKRNQYNDKFEALQKALAPNCERIIGPSFLDIKLSFVNLLLSLQERNMLPCIVFTLNRTHCKVLTEAVIDYCTDQEELYQEKYNIREAKVSTKEKHAAKKDKDKNDEDWLSRGNPKEDDYHPWFDYECHSGVTFQEIKEQLTCETPLGKGFSKDDVSYFYDRLKYTERKDSNFMKGIAYGICYHHSGLNNKQRMAVESMLRMKFLNVVVATTTLAVGIHVPCKTVVIAGDEIYLTPLTYRQMAGRAGRRGFDNVGRVIFLGVPERKVKRLMAANLPKLTGNFPISTTLCLRLLAVVKEVRQRGQKTECARQDTLVRVLSLLKHPLLLQEQAKLNVQFQHFFLFSVQFLARQGLLDCNAAPVGLAGIVIHLHYHEPGNFAFVSCIYEGLLQKICLAPDARNSEGKFSEVTMRKLALVTCYFFTSRSIHQSQLPKAKGVNHVILPPLPDDFQKHLESYNKQVNRVFSSYLTSSATCMEKLYGEDNKLPLSNISFNSSRDYEMPKSASKRNKRRKTTIEQIFYKKCHKNKICSSFAALSGFTDSTLSDLEKLIKNVRHEVFTDIKVIPTFNLDYQRNSYAYDYFKNTNRRALEEENHIPHHDQYTLLLDFLLALKAIATSLELYTNTESFKSGGRVNKGLDVLAKAYRQLAGAFSERFNERFPNTGY